MTNNLLQLSLNILLLFIFHLVSSIIAAKLTAHNFVSAIKAMNERERGKLRAADNL